MKNLLIGLFMVSLTACGGSDGRGAVDPGYVGTYHTSCQVSGSDSYVGRLAITAETIRYTAFGYTGNTTCSGAGVEGPYPAAGQYTVLTSSASTFEFSTSGGPFLIKIISGGLILDLLPSATFSPDWDYATEGSYLEFIRD